MTIKDIFKKCIIVKKCIIIYFLDDRLTGMQFSTFDVKNEMCYTNCAASYYGGWWFHCCYNAFLNGPWLSKSWDYPWYPQYTSGTNVNGTSMLIK